jgi:restriction endonuclease S subunit
MATIKPIKVNELSEDLRIDPEFYQPKFMNNDKIISGITSDKLGAIADIIYGTTPQDGRFEESGISFIRSQNFSDYIVSNDFVFCSEKFHLEHSGSKCCNGDLLFAAIGATIGSFAIIPPWIKEANTNQNIARVRINNSKYKAEYVWAFFLSRYGQLQLERYPTGNAQPYLNTFQFNRFTIPFISNQEQFVTMLKGILKQVEYANKLYPEAEKELLDRLEFKKINIGHVLDYSTETKNILESERLDPEFYQPKFEYLLKQLKKAGAKKLSEFCPQPKRGVSPLYHPDGDVAIVNSQHLSDNGIIDIDNLNKTNEEFYSHLKNANARLKKLDVLVYATGAYIGRTNCWLEDKKAIAGIDCIIIQPNRNICNPIYLALFLNSKAGLLQANQQASGSAQRHLYPYDMTNYEVFIPHNKDGKPDLAWQDKLANKVMQANQAKREAKQKLQEAKKLVEKEIKKMLKKKGR